MTDIVFSHHNILINIQRQGVCRLKLIGCSVKHPQGVDNRIRKTWRPKNVNEMSYCVQSLGCTRASPMEPLHLRCTVSSSEELQKQFCPAHALPSVKLFLCRNQTHHIWCPVQLTALQKSVSVTTASPD